MSEEFEKSLRLVVMTTVFILTLGSIWIYNLWGAVFYVLCVMFSYLFLILLLG